MFLFIIVISFWFSQKFSFIIFFLLCVRLEYFEHLALLPLTLYTCVCVQPLYHPPTHALPNATAHKMIKKCFEHNAYLCVHRQAQAVNKLNI